MKIILGLVFCLLFPITTALAQNQFSTESLRAIDRALIELSVVKTENVHLNTLIDVQEQQIKLLQEKVDLEHGMILSTKKLHLTALETLQEYKTKKRSLFVKIITLSLVRDSIDKNLRSQIEQLREEIKNWK